MLYNIEQVGKLLNKVSKTIYRAHKRYNVGTLHEVAEGRRLLFTEDELVFLKQTIFADTRKEKLLATPQVKKIICALLENPMSVYELARVTNINKGTLQSLLATMSHAFKTLAEDEQGILYFTDGKHPISNDSVRVRHAFWANESKKYVLWETFLNIPIPYDVSYYLTNTDNCLNIFDVKGKILYENDFIMCNETRMLATEVIYDDFLIVGNTYMNTVDAQLK